MTLLLVALAGGFGAVARFVLDGVVNARRRDPQRLPLGTMLVNLTGSLLLGVVTGLAVGQLLPERLHQILGTGFLGGYTTFSTAAVETARLLRSGRRLVVLVNGLGMLMLSVGLAAVGYAAATALP